VFGTHLQQAYQQITLEKIKKTTIALGIESKVNGINGKFSIHTPSGTSVPCENSRKYFTVAKNQTYMKIKTCKGKSENSSVRLRNIKC